MLRVEVSNFLEDRFGKDDALPRFVELNEPEIDLILLLSFQVFDSEALKKLLESPDHVPKEADPNHLDEHLETVLDLGETGDVAVAN